MKKLLSLIALLAIVSLASCGTTEEVEVTIPDDANVQIDTDDNIVIDFIDETEVVDTPVVSEEEMTEFVIDSDVVTSEESEVIVETTAE